MVPARAFAFVLLLPAILGQLNELVRGLNKAADFTLEHYKEMNFDGLLGFVISEAQLRQSAKLTSDRRILQNLEILLEKCEEIRRRVSPILPKTPRKMPVLERHLLRPEKWTIDGDFTDHSLRNSGIYRNWTADDIVQDKSASYRGVPSDFCLMEVLHEDCHVGKFCREMMLAPRVDRGYLLSHRLFYLQIGRLRQCRHDSKTFGSYTRRFCSLMLKELRTNAHLGFPSRDIALEQMVLCGLEGYSEFLDQKWRTKVIEWQTPQGCYRNEPEVNSKRSSNVISYGCSDHTTGLGAAALALNVKYVLMKIKSQ